MADLTTVEKTKLERLFGMGGGYVLDLNYRPYRDFFEDVAHVDIFSEKYNRYSGSKANRMRAFWLHENNHLVSRVIDALIDYGEAQGHWNEAEARLLVDEGRRIAARLAAAASPVTEIDALTTAMEQLDLATVAQQVRDAVELGQVESVLDRLHTFLMRYVRTLCDQHGIVVDRDKPLHSLFGELLKRWREDGHIESEMTERILKSTISVLEAFSDVRNRRSLAHDNPTLNHEESLLIANHVASSVRFLESVQDKIAAAKQAAAQTTWDDDEPVPF